MNVFLWIASCCSALFTTTETAPQEEGEQQEACCFEAPPAYCPSCLRVGGDVTLALDDFRGIYDGSWNGSFGGVAAANFLFPLPRSFAAQVAGSYGLYDWAGRASTPFKNSKTLQQQGFVTAAFSYQTPCPTGWNAGVAYDWMLNKNFGLFAVDPDFDQVRGQFGYVIQGANESGNEIGLWGTYGIRKAHEHSQNIPLVFRGISQVNLFWCHYFRCRGYGMLWAGTPYRRGLHYKDGRAGIYIIGAQFSFTITDSLSIDGHASYMAPRGGSGVNPSRNYGSNIYFGLTYSWGKRRVTRSPYMTLANNTNFMADTNQNF